MRAPLRIPSGLFTAPHPSESSPFPLFLLLMSGKEAWIELSVEAWQEPGSEAFASWASCQPPSDDLSAFRRAFGIAARMKSLFGSSLLSMLGMLRQTSASPPRCLWQLRRNDGEEEGQRRGRKVEEREGEEKNSGERRSTRWERFQRAVSEILTLGSCLWDGER